MAQDNIGFIALICGIFALVLALAGFLPISYNELEDTPNFEGLENKFEYFYNSYFITRGQVLWLPFIEGDGSITSDFSNFYNHGIISNALWDDGKYGKALSFDDTDYVNILHNTSLIFGTGDFSIVLWAKTSVNGNYQVLSKATGYPTVVGYAIFFRDGSAIWYSYSFNESPIINLTFNYSDGLWHHYVITRTDGTAYFYVDNILKASATDSGNIVDTTDLRLGKQAYDGIIGLIDEVRIYNRALTEFEINILYEMRGLE